ncbi:uncharacterized protein ACNS7B_017396 [Menidia menidia]
MHKEDSLKGIKRLLGLRDSARHGRRRLQDAEIRPAKWGRSQDFLLKSTETQDYLTQLQHAETGPAPTLNSIRNRIRSGQGLKTLLNLLQQMLTSTGAADQASC